MRREYSKDGFTSTAYTCYPVAMNLEDFKHEIGALLDEVNELYEDD